MNSFHRTTFVTAAFRFLSFSVFLLGITSHIHAQWLTQAFTLTNGWNAVFLHVDASHTTLDSTVGNDVNNPIMEVWRWNPGTTPQYIDSPQDPIDTGSQWMNWDRSDTNSTLQRMVGNSAYLVRVGTNVSSYTWTIKGKPVGPVNNWTTTGLNFIGFPTVPSGPPTFENFLALAPDLQQNAEIYYYRGNDLGSNNPIKALTWRTMTVKRGQAFWIRSGTAFNRYFGPFELDLKSTTGVDFQTSLNTSALTLRNLTTNNLTVTLSVLASETPPTGQAAVAGLPPILVRGSLNFTNLTYGYTNLPVNGTKSWTLAPQGQSGSEVEVVLGLNRYAITNAPGALLAGILRFTDSLGFSQLDAPVMATVGSAAGLWVGRALVRQLEQTTITNVLDVRGNLVVDTNGQYVMATNIQLTPVAAPFPLRLIVHNPTNSAGAYLLQRVFVGYDANTNFVAATKESVLNANLLQSARRISAVHLPFSAANTPWLFSGTIGVSSNITATVSEAYDDQASNPFLHTYHPDHDNLDATFKNILPQGSESYSIQRQITLSITPPGNDFSSLTAGFQTISGDYLETITLSGLGRAGGTYDTRKYRVRGTSVLNRISQVPTLTIVP